MGFMSDVKSTRLGASGDIFGGRTRVKGIYIVPGTNAGSVAIRDGGASGAVISTLDTPAGGGAIYLRLPEDGLLCTVSSYATLTGVTAVTVFYA
jgi:hypothetical protein